MYAAFRSAAFAFATLSGFSAITACASSSRSDSDSAPTVVPASAQRQGTFRFSERVPDTSPNTIVLEGVVTVRADTVELDMTPGPCRYAQPSRQSRTAFNYECADVFVTIDRQDPSRVSYSLTTRITVDRNVCVAFQGSRCIRYEVVKEEVTARRSGRLRLIRAS